VEDGEGWVGEEGRERQTFAFLETGILTLSFWPSSCTGLVLCCLGWEGEGLKLSDRQRRQKFYRNVRR
jgi:hypothetical protein